MKAFPLALILVGSTVALAATAPSAAACTPPNCGTHCELRYAEPAVWYDPLTGEEHSVRVPVGIDCDY